MTWPDTRNLLVMVLSVRPDAGMWCVGWIDLVMGWITRGVIDHVGVWCERGARRGSASFRLCVCVRCARARVCVYVRACVCVCRCCADMRACEVLCVL